MRFSIFQKGHPNYSPTLPADLVAARKLTRNEFERHVNQFLFMTADEMKAVQKDPKTTMLEHLIIGIIGKATKEGDQKRLNMILDRLIGPVIRPVPVLIQDDRQPERAPEGVTIDVTKISDTTLKELMYAGSRAPNK